MNSSVPNFLPDDDELESFKSLEMAKKSNAESTSDDFYDVLSALKPKESEFVKKFSFEKPQSSETTEKPKKQTELMNSSSGQEVQSRSDISERHHQRKRLGRSAKQTSSTIIRARNDKVRVEGENTKRKPGKQLQSVYESETDDEVEDIIYTTKPPPLRISRRIQGKNKTILQRKIPSKGASQSQNPTASMLVDSEDYNSEDNDVLMTSYRHTIIFDKLS